MRAIASWLARLRNPEHSTLKEHLFRVIVPGSTPIDVDRWLIATDPQGVWPSARTASPEAWSVLRLCDEGERRVAEHERLTSEIAGLMSLAINRRIDIPFEVAARREGSDRVVFLSYGHVLDKTMLGPLPADLVTRFGELVSRVAGLTESDQDILGNVVSLFHASMLLFEREARSAYALLIAGIEVLSREYGEPPHDWRSWEDHSHWDELFTSIDLSQSQSDAMRDSLVQNRQLRLKATFRSYASQRVPETFWERTYDEWEYPVDVTNGKPHEPPLHERRRVQDILPLDRDGLSRALGESYNLRSRFVHRGQWLSPLDLVLPHGAAVAWDEPLPYSVLRLLLAELLRTELGARSTPSDLPEFSVLRGRSSGEPRAPR